MKVQSAVNVGILMMAVLWSPMVWAQAQPGAKPAAGAPAKEAAAGPAKADPVLEDAVPGIGASEMGSKEEVEEMLRGEMGERAGDQKKFQVRTDSDIATLEVGDLYKNEETAYKIVAIGRKSAKGGQFTAQRIAGQNDPMRRWIRLSGSGPANIITRTTLLDYYLQGGFFMHPILILFVAMLVLTINDVLIYRSKVQCPPEFVTAAEDALKQGNLQRFEELARNAKGLMPYICRLMAKDADTTSLADIRSRVEVATASYVNRMRIPVRALNLISATSPLLGLMGTIQGMIVVFEGIAGTSNAGRAAVLASGIRTALFTTVAGLAVAIPGLFSYFALNQKHGALVGECETVFERFMFLLGQRKGSKGQDAGEPGDDKRRKVVRE